MLPLRCAITQIIGESPLRLVGMKSREALSARAITKHVSLVYAVQCQPQEHYNYVRTCLWFRGACTCINKFLSRFVPSLSVTRKSSSLSLDEAYLDVTDSSACRGSATLIAESIRHDIHVELGLTASAGIAPIKFLAKVASDMNKPNGQFVIPPDKVQEVVDKLPLEKFLE